MSNDPAASNSDVLAHARAFAARGLSVVPVPRRPRPGAREGAPGDGKVPAIAWREYQTRLPTASEIAAWFSDEPMNIAVITGAISQAVVIDADSRDALR